MEAPVHTRVSPCGIYGGQSCTGTGFSLSCLVFPCQYHSTVDELGMNNRHVGGRTLAYCNLPVFFSAHILKPL
jgi:hypothetical protein